MFPEFHVAKDILSKVEGPGSCQLITVAVIVVRQTFIEKQFSHRLKD